MTDRTDSLIDTYRAERAEARACGDLDFPTFNEWRRGADPKAEAQERIGDIWAIQDDPSY